MSAEKSTALTEEEFLILHRKYKESKDVSIRNDIVINFMFIPKACAVQLKGITSGYAQIEDMVNHGVMTLIECVEKYDETKGVKFESYAYMRVRGAMIDLVRKQDWIPRRVRNVSKEITEAYSKLANEFMREPTQKELADSLNISIEKLSQYNSEIANMTSISFEEFAQNTVRPDEMMDVSAYDDYYPEKSLLKSELKEVLKEAIENLSDKEKLVISLYYYENLMFSDIAKVMDVTPQRVSQIHTKAVMKMKSKMEIYINEAV